MESSQVTTQDIFVFEKTGINSAGKVTGRFRATGVRPKFYEKIRAIGMELPGSLFQGFTEIN
jgi:pilus assembly protein CpaF